VPTVVVTGVCGALGQRVTALLAARGDVPEIVGIDLEEPERPMPGVSFHRLDLAGPSNTVDLALQRAMAGVDTVVHLAWRGIDSLDDPRHEASAAKANSVMLNRLLEAIAVTGTKSFVHLSSATVYGAWADNTIPLTEDARLRPNPEFPFAVSKAECERVVAEWSDAHPEERVVVLRPAVTVGVSAIPLYRALGATGSPRSGDGSRPVQYLHVDDLARAVVLAVEKPLDGVYNVAPDAGIREDEAGSLAGGVARLTLPSKVAAAVSAWSWNLWRTGVPAEARAYATHPWVVASDRLKAAGWRPQYTSEEALVATDARVHWDDLPPGRRQNYNLAVLLIAAAGVAATAAGGFEALRRARRGARSEP
jgi:nucleoside-diphosphate-sugar epimerase